ncbi:hypothetical protein ABID99_005332 [Mucilaginibacter sp. OAE612]
MLDMRFETKRVGYPLCRLSKQPNELEISNLISNVSDLHFVIHNTQPVRTEAVLVLLVGAYYSKATGGKLLHKA